ncbi:MAG TPA: hypothetical protein VGM76_11770 [Lacipirellulaceae bacterium]|jgi:hypothetical protein
MRTAVAICALAPILLTAGCHALMDAPVAKGRSPLRPMASSPDSVALEIIWARFPQNDPALNDSVWAQIDETQLPPDVQRELVNNGFRAGVLAGAPPAAIARVINLKTDKPEQGPNKLAAKASVEPPPGDATQDLLSEPTVKHRLLQLRRGRRAEIQASEVLDSVPLLVTSGRELGGHTYRDAQAIYALRVDPQPDQTVGIELTPELHHGQSRVHWSGGEDGILRQAPSRDREVFEAMRINVRLSPGEMLVLMSLPDAGSRLGHVFHSVDTADGPQQKLVLIRLAQVPRSDTFDIPGEH